jgi:hypothetical protein
MTNREMLSAIKNVEPLIEHIESVVFDIIKDTFDYHIRYVEDISVLDTYVVVYYENSYRGVYEHNGVKIPIEWFDEGFDYVKAYTEFLRKEEAKRKRAEKARLKRAAETRKRTKELKAKKEYETYLKLKKKYENGENK